MIREDNKNIYIDSFNDITILKKLKDSRYGSNSNIYFYNDVLLKIYNYKINISELKILENMQKLHLKNVSIPKKIIFIDEMFYGYSMDFKKGNVLNNINPNIEYNKLISNLNDIEQTIKVFSNKKIEMIDLNCFNILYDELNNEYNIVDIDSYIKNRLLSIDKIFEDNIYYFSKILLDSIMSSNKQFITDIYRKLDQILKSNKKSHLLNTFKLIKDVLENYSNREIKTVNDFRKVLKKQNNIYKI